MYNPSSDVCILYHQRGAESGNKTKNLVGELQTPPYKKDKG